MEMRNPTEIGQAWLEDSSLEKWFPISAEQIQRQAAIIREFKERYHEMSQRIAFLEAKLIENNIKTT